MLVSSYQYLYGIKLDACIVLYMHQRITYVECTLSHTLCELHLACGPAWRHCVKKACGGSERWKRLAAMMDARKSVAFLSLSHRIHNQSHALSYLCISASAASPNNLWLLEGTVSVLHRVWILTGICHVLRKNLLRALVVRIPQVSNSYSRSCNSTKCSI